MEASSAQAVTTGLVAVLFTDVVGSTELWVRLGEARADEMRRRLRSASDRVVATSHGTVVKDLGDGVMATFPTASACIDAAVELQRVSMQLGRASGVDDLRIRVGASIGEASRDGDDWFGTPVVEAARLCALAEAGQILVHDTIALLARRAEHEAVPIGLRDLKGLPDPVPVREIPWVITPTATSALPPMLRPPDDAMPFVGRSNALALLQRARTKMATEHFAVVSGEPGVGKTRLVSEFAADWATAGGVVVGTWFNESGESFTRSVTRLLRQLADIAPPPAWSGSVLDRLTGAAGSSGSEIDPAEVGDVLAGWIVGATADRPALVVLDDLHWAPQAALTMLEAVLEGLEQSSVLVIGTYRDTDLDRKHPLADWLASRRRNERPDRIDLHGLEFDDVVGLLAGTSHDVDPAVRTLSEELYRETEGNAFFVGQMIEHLRETGVLEGEPGRLRVVGGVDRLGLPQGVRELVGRRLRLLPDGSDEVLAIAAVQGRAFSVAVTTTAMAGSTDRVIDVFDTATRAGLVEPVAGSLDRFQFVHALVRETVLDEIPPLRRCRLHLEIGRALDTLAPQAVGLASLEIARHHLEGAALGGLPRAVDLIERNVEDLLPDFVVEKLELLHSALAAAEEVGLDDRRLIQLHRHLGAITWMVDGNRSAGRDSFRTAVAFARATGDNDLLAETISYVPGASFGVDPEFTELAAAVLPLVDRSSPAALRLRQVVGYAQTMIAPPGVDLAAEYADIQRAASGQAGPLTTFSAPWFFHASPDLAQLRSYRAEGPFFTWAWARTDLGAAQRYLDELASETRRLTPLMQGVVDQMQSLLAMARGDFDEAAHQTDLLEEHGGSDPMFAVGIPWQRAAQALWRGDVATARQLSGYLPALSFYPALVALAEADLLDREGDRTAALAAFEQAWAIGPGNLGLDWTYTGTLSRFAELAARFDMPERCAELEPLVRPFDGQFILETCIELRCSAAWLLGGLARAQGHIDEAIAHYERALAFETANGAVLMAQRTRDDLERVRVSG